MAAVHTVNLADDVASSLQTNANASVMDIAHDL